MKVSLLAVLLLFTILISGCKKNVSYLAASTSGVYLPSMRIEKKVGGITDTVLYTYDNRNRIVEEVGFKFNSHNDYKLIYNDNDQLIEADYYGVESDKVTKHFFIKNTYTYAGDSVIQKSTYPAAVTAGNPDTASYLVEKLNSSGFPIKIYTLNTLPSIISIYTYDAKGNQTSTTAYQDKSLDYITTNTFDNNKSTLVNIRGNYYIYPYLFYTSFKNNVASSNYLSYLVPSNSTIYTYTFDFNDAGYPVNQAGVDIATNQIVETFTNYYIVR